MLHFVGDLHQPLHAGDNHDRGGNCVQISLGGVRSTNLHSWWDTGVVELLGASPEALATQLGTHNRRRSGELVGRRRLNGASGRALMDPATGEQVLLIKRHTLFWIPMQYWSAPMLLLAVPPLFALPVPGS